MKNKLSILIFTLLFFSTTKSFAWGKTGHSLVAEIAFNYLDAQTKSNVLNILNGMSIEEAASWMDNLRSDKSYDYLKPYHYIKIEKGMFYQESSEDNIVNALQKAIDDLRGCTKLSKDETKLKLLIIFHLVGDLHQPLHAGYGIDKGGNTIQISFFGKGSNLHRLWDSDMIEYKKITLQNCLALNVYSKKDLKKIKRINVVNWMNDSRSHLNQVYNFSSNKIDDTYVNENIVTVEKQLLIAGIRLASVLKKCFYNVKQD